MRKSQDNPVKNKLIHFILVSLFFSVFLRFEIRALKTSAEVLPVKKKPRKLSAKCFFTKAQQVSP